jgi:hypothetical protein
MEDRITPALWLEMGDTAGDTALLDTPGVERVTWWENVHPNRNDLPRVLPEFAVLTMYECRDGFAPPAGRPGHHFTHYPRPGQGCVTGRPTLGLSLVLIAPKDPADTDAAQSLRDWGDFVHIRHIAASGNPGYAMITPYQRVDPGPDDPWFLHLYEIDEDDPERVYKAMTPRVMDRLGGGFGTPAFDDWAFHPALRIMYVNTFRLLDEAFPAG